MKQRDEILVGAMLLITLILGIGGTLWIAQGGLSRSYPMYAKFPWGAGLKQGQPVLLAGVNVGFVDGVELVPDGTLTVQLSIRKQYHVPVGTTATVEPNGIFGDQLVALTPVRATTDFLPEKDTIPTGKPTAGVAALLNKGDSIALDVRALTTRLRSEFVDSGGIRDVHRTMGDLTKLVAQLSKVVNEQSKELTLTQTQLRNKINSVDSAKIDSILVNARTISANGEKLMRAIDSTRTAVDDSIAKASSGPGTMGRLMNDSTLYKRVDKLVARLDSLSTEFQKNPRKFINLKIF